MVEKGQAEMRTRMSLLTAIVLLSGACGAGDESRAETDEIIDSWIEAWMSEDYQGVAALYAEDGTYADAGCPFEMNGKSAIRNMVMGHLQWTDYTTVEAVEIIYSDTGATVQWIWGGTNDGEPFTMEPSTIFEIEDGLIVRSTDQYERSEAPPGWEQDCIQYNRE